eukprot:m.338158 g.338158  ORF g.338158 m.338158 type:complete len:135 (-) comp16533_c6_seq13:581-985(-)
MSGSTPLAKQVDETVCQPHWPKLHWCTPLLDLLSNSSGITDKVFVGAGAPEVSTLVVAVVSTMYKLSCNELDCASQCYIVDTPGCRHTDSPSFTKLCKQLIEMPGRRRGHDRSLVKITFETNVLGSRRVLSHAG